jgi:hypothetical protein
VGQAYIARRPQIEQQLIAGGEVLTEHAFINSIGDCEALLERHNPAFLQAERAELLARVLGDEAGRPGFASVLAPAVAEPQLVPQPMPQAIPHSIPQLIPQLIPQPMPRPMSQAPQHVAQGCSQGPQKADISPKIPHHANPDNG